MQVIIKIFTLAGLTLITSSCAILGPPKPPTPGVVISATPTMVDSGSMVGTLTGAAAGAALGSHVGGGKKMHILGGIGGAVLGGLAGGAAEEQMTKRPGMEYVVRTSIGTLETIDQETTPVINPGEHVIILYNAGTPHIVPNQEYVEPKKKHLTH
jgi:outer membrane lipoprotein SlyB